MRGLIAPQNTFLDTIATRFDGTREYRIPTIFGCSYSLCLTIQVDQIVYLAKTERKIPEL